MANKLTKEHKGAWVVHHGQKVALDTYGASEYPAIDEAAKAATLLSRLGEAQQTTLPLETVQAVARAAGLNPRFELDGLLATLAKKRLIDRSAKEVVVLGVTMRGAVAQAAELFDEASPNAYELAAIDLAEISSDAPVSRTTAEEFVSDTYKLASSNTKEFITKAEQIGFVDSEGDGADKLLFNGNLFRRGGIEKAAKVLSSLSSAEQAKMAEFNGKLQAAGCLEATAANSILGDELFSKLRAASVYDLNTVSNESGEHVFITAPSAFHKFVDPMVDDTFDMAKALVAALTFGMTRSPSTRGQITMLPALLSRLITGGTVGPAPAIGMDYRVLEERRVVQTFRSGSSFSMKLLKPEVGQLALQVLKSGDANATAMTALPGAPMSGYSGPEASRVRVRKTQVARSKRQTLDVLQALRSGRGI